MRFFVLTLLTCIIAIKGVCQTNSFRTLDDLTDSIRVIMKEEHITGLMLGICTKDSVLFSGGFGYADLEAGRKVDSVSLFRLGSITKMFVSLGILKLIEQGELSLNDELKKIAPQVPFQNQWESTNPVRLVHLLEHTSGFDDMKLNSMYREDSVSGDGKTMMLAQSRSLKCRWKPGERFSYSNPNYTVLGYIIEIISGQPYAEYLKRNILQPLGMSHTNFNLWSKYPEQDTKEYFIRNGLPVRVNPVVSVSGPPGAVWSSSGDMTRFIQLFLRKGNPVFPSSLIDTMETPHSSLAAREGQKSGYALGNDNVGFLFAGVPFHGHGGLMGTCYSGMRYSRLLDLGFVVSTNSNRPTARIEQLIVSFFEKDVKSAPVRPVPLNSEKIRAFEGVYQFESPRNAISGFVDRLQYVEKIYLRNGKLWIKHLYGPAYELIQTGDMIFTLKGMNSPFIRLTKNEEGRRVVLLGGTYYEHTTAFYAYAYRTGVLIAVFIFILSILVFLVSIVGSVLKRISWKETGKRFIPVIGIAGLLLASLQLNSVKANSYLLARFNSVNLLTLSIFIGTAVFGAAAMIVLFQVIKDFRTFKNRWFILYQLLLASSLLFIGGILLVNGWIGLRVWRD